MLDRDNIGKISYRSPTRIPRAKQTTKLPLGIFRIIICKVVEIHPRRQRPLRQTLDEEILRGTSVAHPTILGSI